jgi:hypothetical protein
MAIDAASELDSTPAHPLLLPLAAAAACAAPADWLFSRLADRHLAGAVFRRDRHGRGRRQRRQRATAGWWRIIMWSTASKSPAAVPFSIWDIWHGSTAPGAAAHRSALGEMSAVAVQKHRTVLVGSSYRDNFPRPENWRVWGFRAWRLQRYYAN